MIRLSINRCKSIVPVGIIECRERETDFDNKMTRFVPSRYAQVESIRGISAWPVFRDGPTK